MSEERNMIPLILTGIGTIIGTVGCLWYYGYLHFAKPEDALLLSDVLVNNKKQAVRCMGQETPQLQQ